MNNAVFEKDMEHARNHRDIKFTTMKQKEIIWCQKQTIVQKKFSDDLLIIEMKKTQILINKPIYLGLSILKISEIVIYEFWYDPAKLEHGRKKVQLCYMYRDCFIVYIKAKDNDGNNQ